MVTQVAHHLAEFNVGRLRRPLDAEETAEFVAALEPVNALAESTPGFVWRLTDEDGQSSSYVNLPAIDDPLVIVNYSVWVDVASLHHFVYTTDHAGYLRRRREWFEPSDQPVTVCWWTPAGVIDDVADAYARLEKLREHGPSADGWPLRHPLPPPDG